MRRRVYAVAALVVAVAGLSPVVHDATHHSFAVHMIQHLVLVLVVAPLLAAGTTEAYAPRGRWATAAVSVVLLHTIAMWGWHLPALYEAAAANDGLHVGEHVSFLGTAWIFWLLVLRDGDHLKRAGAVFAVGLQSAALGALLTFASEPLYASHAGGYPRWGLTALEDQQLAGGIMWVPPGIVYLAVTLGLLRGWLKRSGEPVTDP